MIRVCPKRDTECPHGMDCPYTIDRYSCQDEDSPPSPMKDDLIERLLWVKWESAKDGRFKRPHLNREGIEEVAQALKAKDTEIAKLREALEPFAARADAFEAVGGEYSEEDWTNLQLTHFRNARTALGGSNG